MAYLHFCLCVEILFTFPKKTTLLCQTCCKVPTQSWNGLVGGCVCAGTRAASSKHIAVHLLDWPCHTNQESGLPPIITDTVGLSKLWQPILLSLTTCLCQIGWNCVTGLNSLHCAVVAEWESWSTLERQFSPSPPPLHRLVAKSYKCSSPASKGMRRKDFWPPLPFFRNLGWGGLWPISP